MNEEKVNVGNPGHIDHDTRIDLSKADRGELTKEQLEAEMTPEALELVNQMELRTIAEFAKNSKAARHFKRKNRDSWERMNRPSRLASIERGTQKILNLMAGVGFVTDDAIKKEIPA